MSGRHPARALAQARGVTLASPLLPRPLVRQQGRIERVQQMSSAPKYSSEGRGRNPRRCRQSRRHPPRRECAGETRVRGHQQRVPGREVGESGARGYGPFSRPEPRVRARQAQRQRLRPPRPGSRSEGRLSPVPIDRWPRVCRRNPAKPAKGSEQRFADDRPERASLAAGTQALRDRKDVSELDRARPEVCGGPPRGCE